MRLLAGVSAVLLVVPAIAANQQSANRQNPARRANELTLAGIRPGRDKIARVFNMYGKAKTGRKGETQFSWVHCQPEVLFVTTDQAGVVQETRVDLRQDVLELDCERKPEIAWKTGKRLENGDLASRVLRLYGEPDSRSPSTKDGQRLELLYYAFDWAGPDVPQVMEVLCTVENDRMPARVVEITLAASSL
jgi:hypothetical protein